MNNFACDGFCCTLRGKDTRDFSSVVSYPQISSIQDNDLFMEGISTNTFPAERYDSVDNQEKLTSSGSLACAKNGVASNSSDVVNFSFESMLHEYEGLPFDTSAKWDFSKYIIPPQLVTRTGVPLVQPAGTNEWAMMDQAGLNSTSRGSSRFSNELSLSLSTSQPSVLHGNSIQEQCSEMSSSYSSSSRNLSLSFNSYKPLQPPLLTGSRFVQAMQEILAEIAQYALENIEDGVNVCIPGRSKQPIEFDGDHTFMFGNKLMHERDVEAKKKHLLALLQLVDERYNQCLDEIHTVTSAFHAVTELDPNLHARFALPTISFMYKNLRQRISSRILAMGAHLSEEETRDEKSFETCFIQKQWALQQLSKRDHQLWRPQRGLPERSVSVLRAWMFQNFLHPYPKDAEKHLLALKSGLTRNQVSNWFINARVRLWKPMIEEMCAEMNGRKARNEETEGDHRNHMCFQSRRFTTD